MRVEELLGRTHLFTVKRLGVHGATLSYEDEDEDEGPPPTLLLPGSEVPEHTEVGDELEAFVYRDSEERPIATLRPPKLELHEVAFLTVKETTPIGAFVDWGLQKDLFVPFAEQTRDLSPGERHAFGLILDRKDRLCATMRVSELFRETEDVRRGEWIEGEAFRDEPGIGLFVILERRFLGLVPAQEPHRLRRGERAQFRVTHVSEDWKIELSLRKAMHEEMDADAQRILDELTSPRPASVGDDSSPEQIRAVFGISKKAFKRAVGRLLKEGAVKIDERGFVVPIGGRRPKG